MLYFKRQEKYRKAYKKYVSSTHENTTMIHLSLTTSDWHTTIRIVKPAGNREHSLQVLDRKEGMGFP